MMHSALQRPNTDFYATRSDDEDSSASETSLTTPFSPAQNSSASEDGGPNVVALTALALKLHELNLSGQDDYNHISDLCLKFVSNSHRPPTTVPFNSYDSIDNDRANGGENNKSDNNINTNRKSHIKNPNITAGIDIANLVSPLVLPNSQSDDALYTADGKDSGAMRGKHATKVENRKLRVQLNPGRVVDSVVCPFDDKVHYPDGLNKEDMTSRQLAGEGKLFSPDFAELSFICRVLAVALKEDTPLLDRFKFLCIVSGNLDEQFSKRLGNKVNVDPEDLELFTHTIRQRVRPKTEYELHLREATQTIVNMQYACLEKTIFPLLKEEGIEIVKYTDLDIAEQADMRVYFEKNLRPVITPMTIDAMHPFPLIQSHNIYLFVDALAPGDINNSSSNNSNLRNKELRRFILIKVPRDRQRLIPVGTSNEKFLRAEDCIINNIQSICCGIKVVNAFPIRVTRNIKLDINEDTLGDWDYGLDFVIDECHRRQQAPATRLEVTSNITQDIIDILTDQLGLDSSDVYKIDSNIIDLSSCFSLSFANPSLAETIKEPVAPKPFKGLYERVQTRPGAIFDVIRKKDVMVEYPRESFKHSAILFLQSAARDPRVKCVKTVVYRSGSNSQVISALVRAAKNGKEVTVLVELKASFDEVQNSTYARELNLAGCNVVYGVRGLKVHTKATLVVREENGKYEYYSNISTGNFNASTAKMYTDMSYYTRRRAIGEDLQNVFNYLTGLSQVKTYRELLVAPHCMLNKFEHLIHTEANNAREGKPARIVAQVNGLTDKTIVEALYDASQAGVKIDLIVRGQCRLRPDIPGKSDNIRVFSWIGDVLQHRRIFFFLNGGDGNEKFFIGSADWRTRNLNDRVEVIVPIPIKNRAIWKRLGKAFDIINDVNRTWRMSWDGRYYQGIPINHSPQFPIPNGILNRPANETSNNTSLCSNEFRSINKVHNELDQEDNEDDGTKDINNNISGHGGHGNSREGVIRTRPPTTPLRKQQMEINIGGENIWVDKKAAGAVPLRFDTIDGQIMNIEVLMLSRGGTGDAQDPWSVPKGGLRANDKSLQEGSIRVAREKGAVLESEVIENVGWLLRMKKNKKIGVHTLILRVKRTGRLPDGISSSSDTERRRMRWIRIKEAIVGAKESGNDFTQEALKLGVDAIMRKYSVCRNAVGTLSGGVPSSGPSSPKIQNNNNNNSAISSPKIILQQHSGTVVTSPIIATPLNNSSNTDARIDDTTSLPPALKPALNTEDGENNNNELLSCSSNEEEGE